MTVLLLIDSTLPGLAVGIADGQTGALLAQAISTPEQGSSTRLSGLVKQVMAERRVSWEEIGGMVLGTGPGSFTGIRMSLAYAYGVKLSIPKIKLAGVSSLVEMQGQTSGGSSFVLPGTRDQGFTVRENGDKSLVPAKFFLGQGPGQTSGLNFPSGDITLLAPWPQFESPDDSPKTKRDSEQGPDANTPKAPRKLIKLYGADLLGYSLKCLSNWGARQDWKVTGLDDNWPVANYLRASTAEEKLNSSL